VDFPFGHRGRRATSGRALDETGHWALQLSAGKPQRIAFTPALVQELDWLLLDAATSAVDEATETHLYRLARV
jgi:vitamin B12/bleomycin/antimicrobial peptide transport system ATP-binding/permease protein